MQIFDGQWPEVCADDATLGFRNVVFDLHGLLRRPMSLSRSSAAPDFLRAPPYHTRAGLVPCSTVSPRKPIRAEEESRPMCSAIPETMTAIEVRTPGGPEQLVATTRPVPKPGKGEVLLKVAGAGVNRADTLQRQGKYPM